MTGKAELRFVDQLEVSPISFTAGSQTKASKFGQIALLSIETNTNALNKVTNKFIYAILRA